MSDCCHDIFLRTLQRQGCFDFSFAKVGERLNAVEVLNRYCLNNATQTIPPVSLCTTNRETIAINTMMKARLEIGRAHV